MWIEFQSFKVSLKSYSINIATVVRKTYISKILPESSKDNYPRGKSPPQTLKLTLTLTQTLTRGGGAIVRIPCQRIISPISSVTGDVLTETFCLHALAATRGVL